MRFDALREPRPRHAPGRTRRSSEAGRGTTRRGIGCSCERRRREGRRATRLRDREHGRRTRRLDRALGSRSSSMRCRAPSLRRSVVAGRRRRSPRQQCGETAPIRFSTGSRSHGATGSTQLSSGAWCCSTFRTSTRSSATTATKSIGSSRSRISSCGSSSRRSTPTPPCTSVTCARSHRTQLRWRSLSTSRICCRRRTSLPGATTWLGSWLRMAFATSRSWSSRPARGRASKSYGSCSADALPRVGLRSSVSRLTSPMLPGRWRGRAGPERPPASATTIELACSRRSRTPRACR